MSIDIDRLKVDAGYWKENGAPDDATHCAVHDPGKTWFKFGEDGGPMMWHMRFSEWREGLCKESRLVDLIPRLAKADELEWNGTDLPPVGTECEYRVGQERYQVIVIAYAFDEVVVFQKDASPDYTGVQPGYLFPIRTQAQREREDLLTSIIEDYRTSFNSPVSTVELNLISEFANYLFEIGMLRSAGE